MTVVSLDTDIRSGLQAKAERRRDNTLSTIVGRQRVGRLDHGAEAEGVINNPNQFDKDHHGSTVIICKDIADILSKRYPGYLWAVQPSEQGQVINVFCLNLHTKFGYTIRMRDIMDDARRRQAYIAGHEILRRFNMPDRFDPARILEMLRDANGMGIPDIRDFANKKMVRDTEIARKLARGDWAIVEADGSRRYLRAGK